MKKTTPVPLEAAFKAFLTHPDTARDFIELHLPAEFAPFAEGICALAEAIEALRLLNGDI